MKKRILFVAKDQALWNEFQAQEPAATGDWEAQSAATGLEALDLIPVYNFAVVVADYNLPDMSGVELLDQFMRRQPSTHRIILSDISDTESTVKCVGKPHFHLLRPFGIQTLMNALAQAFAHEVWMPSKAVQALIAQMHQVPSPPTTYFKIIKEIQSPYASIETIAGYIAEDPAVTAKVLQLANSAVFGLELQVNQPLEAIAYIGLETTKALVLLAHTVSAFDKNKLAGYSVESLWTHSVCTGRIAQQIALMEKGGLEMAEQSFAAGLLHDIGKLLFCANLPGLFIKTLTLAREEHSNFWEAEAQLFPNAGHAELGAAILNIWGLPKPIIEAVALHHYPRRLGSHGISPLAAVHVANILEHETHPDLSIILPSQINSAYLAELGLAHREEQWRRQCHISNEPALAG
ncbi:MAG: response regulator [Verrucomicrobiota bacterium]|jgi:HD-like signal output (HDOD) protein